MSSGLCAANITNDAPAIVGLVFVSEPTLVG